MASLALLASIANAAQENPELNPIVVTAGRFEQNLTELVTDVVVINREQIERSSANTLGELLSIQSGVQMNRDGGAGQPESIFIRGGNSSHTLFLIDGVKIGSATAGAASFENIPLSQIEKIVALLHKEFAKVADKIQASPIKGEATVYVRNGDIAIGLSFTSKLAAEQMELDELHAKLEQVKVQKSDLDISLNKFYDLHRKGIYNKIIKNNLPFDQTKSSIKCYQNTKEYYSNFQVNL